MVCYRVTSACVKAKSELHYSGKVYFLIYRGPVAIRVCSAAYPYSYDVVPALVRYFVENMHFKPFAARTAEAETEVLTG